MSRETARFGRPDVPRILLSLRRFIGAPLPATAYRIRGVVHQDAVIRVYLARPDEAGLVALDLPVRHPDRPRSHGPWWYVGALRAVAMALTDGRISTDQRDDLPFTRRHVTATTLLAGGILPEEYEVTDDDAVDYLIGDLVADPLWHDAEASAEPGLYTVVGFIALSQATARVYLRRAEGVIAVDLATRGEDGHPKAPGWWASTKLIAILNPRDPDTLAAHRAAVDDPYCGAVYDLTRWA